MTDEARAGAGGANLPEMPCLAPGRVLNGKWTLGPLLGSGAAGTVHAATHRNGTRAAIKILHPRLLEDEEHVARFLREGYIANLLGHHGVVAVLDDDRAEDGLVYLVMELLDGTCLAELIERRAPFSVAEALDITDKILDVLSVAHEKGVVHRDIKPGNVFVLRDGAIKVLDFGIACARGKRDGHGSALANPTRPGTIIGTPGFMPPEQARGRTELIDARTDLWAAAAVLFAMLTGRRLHAGATPTEELARAMLEAAPPVRTVLRSLPEVVARLVDHGLAFHRERRFQTAQRMQGAVRFALQSVLASPVRGETVERPTVRKEEEEEAVAPARPATRVARSLPIVGLVLGATTLAAVVWLGCTVVRSPPRGHGVITAPAEPAAEPETAVDPLARRR